jgi:hypothetical protein
MESGACCAKTSEGCLVHEAHTNDIELCTTLNLIRYELVGQDNLHFALESLDFLHRHANHRTINFHINLLLH